MRRTSFYRNTFALSIMYDAMFFLVCVSLSGVLLLPAFTSQIALQTSIEKHRETIAEDALHTYLVSRVDIFDYTLGGDLIDSVAQSLGINTSSEGLYQTVRNWVLAHEQRHNTHAQLLAEDLACQFQLPLTVFGSNRANVFTNDFDTQLVQETHQFFSGFLGDKYAYNFTATWQPIQGIAFGGNLSIGVTPPTTDTHVAHTRIIIPYTPKITIGNTTIIFTKHWMKTLLQQSFQWENNQTGLSSIPGLNNITRLFANCTQQNMTIETMKIFLKENISRLVNDFLVTGIRNETNHTVFSGIVNLTLTYGFAKIKNALNGLIENALQKFLGGSFHKLDSVFFDLNGSRENPLLHGIFHYINESLQTILNRSVGSLAEAFIVLETLIKENISLCIYQFLDPYITTFVDFIGEIITEFLELRNLIDYCIGCFIDWIFDRISLNTAEVTLTIWEAR